MLYTLDLSSDRTILHLDMDDFFAAIEQRDDPPLRGKPLLIGHEGPRGVVATANTRPGRGERPAAKIFSKNPILMQGLRGLCTLRRLRGRA